MITLNRYVISNKRTSEYVAAVYAEFFIPYTKADQADRPGGNFWIGDLVVGSVYTDTHDVADSRGTYEWTSEKELELRFISHVVSCLKLHIEHMRRDGMANSLGHAEQILEDANAIASIALGVDYEVPLHHV